MTVGQSQLLHFALATATADSTVDAAVRASIRDMWGREVFSLFAGAGQTAAGDVLLAAGRYTVVVTGGTHLPDQALSDLSFTLEGLVRNDPIGTRPIDVSGDPTSIPTAPPPDTTTTKPYARPVLRPVPAPMTPPAANCPTAGDGPRPYGRRISFCLIGGSSRVGWRSTPPGSSQSRRRKNSWPSSMICS